MCWSHITLKLNGWSFTSPWMQVDVKRTACICVSAGIKQNCLCLLCNSHWGRRPSNRLLAWIPLSEVSDERSYSQCDQYNNSTAVVELLAVIIIENLMKLDSHWSIHFRLIWNIINGALRRTCTKPHALNRMTMGPGPKTGGVKFIFQITINLCGKWKVQRSRGKIFNAPTHLRAHS